MGFSKSLFSLGTCLRWTLQSSLEVSNLTQNQPVQTQTSPWQSPGDLPALTPTSWAPLELVWFLDVASQASERTYLVLVFLVSSRGNVTCAIGKAFSLVNNKCEVQSVVFVGHL